MGSKVERIARITDELEVLTQGITNTLAAKLIERITLNEATMDVLDEVDGEQMTEVKREQRRLIRLEARQLTDILRSSDSRSWQQWQANKQKWNASLASERGGIEERKRNDRGLTFCRRCGGAGGYKEWPGQVCYNCHGTGTQPMSAKQQREHKARVAAEQSA